MLNLFTENKKDNQPIDNVTNRRYPVNVKTFNEYYVLFFIFQTIETINSMYLLVIIDILISVGLIV